MSNLNTREEKEYLIRDKLFDEQKQFKKFLEKQSKGANIDSFTYEELDLLIEQYLDEIRTIKQQYLRDHILNQDYDVYQFLDFVSEERLNGQNVDNWTLEELKEIVKIFKKQHQKVEIGQQETQEQQDLRRSQMDDILTKSTVKLAEGINQSIGMIDGGSMGMGVGKWKFPKNNLQLQDIQENNFDSEEDAEQSQLQQENLQQQQKKQEEEQQKQQQKQQQEEQQQQNQQQQQDEENKKSEEELWKEAFKLKQEQDKIKQYTFPLGKLMQPLYEEKVDCVKEKNWLPKHNKLRISIPQTEKAYSGIFGLGGGYILYEIQTEPFMWSVKRKMQDFIDFRKILVKQYPCVWIPPLDTNTKEYTSKDIQVRKQYLVQFLLHLQNSAEIWSNESTQIFLQGHKSWEEHYNKVNKMQDPKMRISSNSGKINLRLSKQNYIYIQESEKFISEAKIQFQNLQTQTVQVQQQFKQLAEKCSGICESHQKLIESINNFSQNLEMQLPQSDELKTIIEDNKFLETTYKNMSNIVQALQKTNKQQADLCDQMHVLYRFSALSLCDNQESYNTQCQLEKQYAKMRENIEYYSLQNPSYRNETKVVQDELKLRQQFAYWQQGLYEQQQNLLNYHTEDYITFFNYFSKYETLRINELTKSWGKSISLYFDSPFPVPKQIDKNQQLQQGSIIQLN